MVFELVYPHPNPLPPAGEGARRRAARSSGANQAKAERSDGPKGLQLPSGRAEKRRAWGGRGSAACRASCSDLLRMFERRERSEQSEFRSAAPRPSIAGCPQRSGGTRPVGSPFSLVTFFLSRQKESDCATGRTSRPAAAPASTATPHPALCPEGPGQQAAALTAFRSARCSAATSSGAARPDRPGRRAPGQEPSAARCRPSRC